MNLKTIATIILLGSTFLSCKKQAGEGGFASIEGKVYVKNYDTFFSYITSQYYLPSETVYIIYGNGTEIGNTVKTSYDGSFKFNYLRKGTYKIFVLGKDSSLALRSQPKAEFREVVISEKKQKEALGDIVILK